uniref:HAD family hydrolase n=1 Tax=Thaumasiovibrio occultus TaxID=1891184 RepID=UPI000B35B9ED|nr:beta-phosphoglucomutase family hydrolase [Thaumasiovibrio occultus]
MIDIDLSRYAGIIFDMDGTLIDSMPTHLKAWRQTAETFGFPFDEHWFYQLGGQPTIKTAAMLKEMYPISAEANDLVQHKYGRYEAIENKGTLIDATYQVLLSAKGEKKLAIGTGSQRHHTEALLKDNQVFDHFDAIVTANDVTEHKPAPATFLSAAEKMGLTPEQCVVFEDTGLGLRAAKAAGMDCYLVENGHIASFHPAQ